MYRDPGLDFNFAGPSAVTAAVEEAEVALAGGAEKIRSVSSSAEVDFEREDGKRGGKCEDEESDDES